MTYVITQLVLLGLAGLGVLWALKSHRLMTRTRIPLSYGLDLRHVAVGLVWLVALVPVAYVIFANELVPKGSPLIFTSTLLLLSAACIGCMMASITRSQLALAKGWLTLVDDSTLLFEAEGATREIALGPGSVDVAFIDGKPQWLQFTLTDGDTEVNLFAMVRMRDLALAREGVLVAPRGMMLAHAATFCDHVRPFVST